MKQKRGYSHWLGGVAVALGLHALVLVVVALSMVKPLPAASVPVGIELWQIPQLQVPEPSETVETVHVPHTDRPVSEPASEPALRPDPVAPRPAKAVQTDDILPMAAKPAPDTAQAVTPKAYDAGGDKGRAALTQALLKREACLEQRRLGKPLDKDCALGEAPDNLVLGVQPPEKRPAKLCIAARERDWQKYREGRAAYPGIRDALKGNKDCRKDWN